MWKNLHHFYPSTLYQGPRIFLKEKYHLKSEDTYDKVEVIVYTIHLKENYHKIGEIDLRLTMNDFMYYYGHLGYHILEKYRGNHYASEACTIIKLLAKEKYDMSELIVTCNPDNYASIKTIERVGGIFIEHVGVPKDHELYRLGEKEKLVYRIKL